MGCAASLLGPLTWTNLLRTLVSRTNVFVIEITSVPLDLATDGFRRRFQEIYYVGIPDMSARKQVLDQALRSYHHEPPSIVNH
jgi:SpoVK/Ycf46/Vps4 family AAA+-type ATPase